MGLLIELASNGREAVDKVEQGGSAFDAILLDLEMPGMDGYQAARLIRQNPLYTKLPIIALTAHAMDGIWPLCQAAGMNDYVAKPIDSVELCKLLLRWIPARMASEEVLEAVATQTRHQQESRGYEQPAQPVTLPGIDVASALRRMNNNVQLFQNMLSIFYREFFAASTTIRTALDEQQEDGRKSARLFVHTIKGMAGNLSAEQLFLAARDLEDAIHEERREDWPPLLNRFDQALHQVMQTIQTYQAENRPETTTATIPPAFRPDEAAIRSGMQKLYGLINASHSDAEELLATLKPSLPTAESASEEMTQLEASLGQYDFEGALIPLKTIAHRLNIALGEDMG